MYGVGDSTNDADLVGWVMVGVQHIPRSEDVPVVGSHVSKYAAFGSLQIPALGYIAASIVEVARCCYIYLFARNERKRDWQATIPVVLHSRPLEWQQTNMPLLKNV